VKKVPYVTKIGWKEKMIQQIKEKRLKNEKRMVSGEQVMYISCVVARHLRKT
jgi:hypothetical protein